MAAATDIHPKVAAGTIGAAVTTVGTWVYEQLAHNMVPGAVQGAVTILIVFALGWLAPERVGEGTPEPMPVVVNAPSAELTPLTVDESADGETPK